VQVHENVNSKTDIANAYAAAYTAQDGDQVLYFALERNDNSGTGNVGFWFLQENANCVGNANFTSKHADGDLFIVSEFSSGGTVSTIQVHRWMGGANGALKTTPEISGAQCGATAADVCAIVNTGNVSTRGRRR
jgi:hypothetical protein